MVTSREHAQEGCLWLGLGIANGGGKTYRSFVGGETYYTVPPQKPLWRPQKVGFVWSVPVSFKEMTWREQMGGGGQMYHRWRGPKPFLGRGFWYVFPPLSFPPPPLLSLMGCSQCSGKRLQSNETYVGLHRKQKIGANKCWARRKPLSLMGARQRSGEGVVRRNGCPKGCFWRVRFFSGPLRFSGPFSCF